MTTKQPNQFGFRFTLYMVTSPIWGPALYLAKEIFGGSRVDRWISRWVSSHYWADQYRYGVKPVCIRCGTERGEHQQ